MIKHNFSIKDLLEFGWSTTKNNYWYILQVMLLALIASGASRFLGPVSIVVSFCVGLSVTTVALMLVSGHSPTIKDLFKKYNDYKPLLNYVLVSLISGLIIFVGFILLIIPGIYFLVKLQFAKILVVDKDMKPLDAIKKSWSMTEGNFVSILLYDLSVLVVNFFGLLLLGIGLLLTIPTTSLASIKLYRKFSGE